MNSIFLLRTLVALLLVAPQLNSELIDRIAVTINQQVVTESQIDEEIRVTFLLNRQPIRWTIDERRAAADRLIQQSLVEREMKLGHYPLPTDAEVQKYFDGIATALGGPSLLDSALQKSKLRSDTLKAHLGLQLMALRFIEYRFRPNFEIADEDVQAYRKRGLPPTSNEAIRETLIQQRTDEILSAWLEETRKQVSIVYLDAALQ